MAYADFSTKKTLNFAAFMGVLGISLFLTFSMREYMPPEFSSFGEMVRTTKINIASVKYSADYNNKIPLAQPDQLLALASTPSFHNTSSDTGQSTTTTSLVPVLLYHGIVSHPDRFSMTPETFADQMFALKRAGYHTITLEEMNRFMRGEENLPDKSFLLTFDDGRTDSYEGADPILKAVGFNAVMFVATGDSLRRTIIGKSYYLKKDDLKAMIHSGRWELGSHAIQENTKAGKIYIDASGNQGNFLSNMMWLWGDNRMETETEYQSRVVRELSESRTDLENTFGIEVNTFAYPFSDYGQQTINNPAATTTVSDTVRRYYNLAFEQVNIHEDIPTDFVADSVHSDPYHLRRVEVGTDWSGEYLLYILNGAGEKKLPYYFDGFASDNGWRKTWGAVSASFNELHMNASRDTTGAFAFLDGTQDWEDYMYAVNAEWQSGSHISLMARYIDANNYAACIISKDSVRIEEKVNGVSHVILHVPNSISIPLPAVSLGVLVDGPFVRCYEGDRVAAFTFNLDPALRRGGIGLQVWDPQIGNASFHIRSISAVPVEDSGMLKSTLPDYTVL